MLPVGMKGLLFKPRGRYQSSLFYRLWSKKAEYWMPTFRYVTRLTVDLAPVLVKYRYCNIDVG